MKNEDPCIYDKKVKFFSHTEMSEDTKAKEKNKEKEKAISLRDYERKIILNRGGHFSSSEDENSTDEKAKCNMLTYAEEQKQLKDSFKNVLKDEDDDADTDLLKIKQKTKAENHKVYYYHKVS